LAGDWPHWRGPGRDGVSAEANWNPRWPAAGPKRLWEAQVGTGFAAVSVAEGRAYTMGNLNNRQDAVWCFDAATGKVIWKHTDACKGGGAGYPGPRTQPTVDGNRVYTLSVYGHLKCLSAADGNVVWQVDAKRQLRAKAPNHGYSCHPVVIGEKLVVEVGAAAGSVVAFDKTDGRVLWQSGKDPVGYSTPLPFTFRGRQCIAMLTGKNLLSMDAANGRELWRYPWDVRYDCAITSPIVSGEKVFISSGYKMGAALLQLGGGRPKVLWRHQEMSNHFNSCVLWKGHLYGFDGADESRRNNKNSLLRCLDFKTGAVRWSHKGLGKGSLMVAAGRLVVLSEYGELLTADATPAGFKPISRAKVLTGRCWTMPVLANGRIYCRNHAGHLICLDVSR